jgi:integrase
LQTSSQSIIIFIADIGCLIGELYSLNIDSVDLEKIEAQAYWKTGNRVLDFTERTADALKTWLIFRGENVEKSSPLFIKFKGGRVTTNQVYLSFRHLAQGLRIKDSTIIPFGTALDKDGLTRVQILN